jgi:hypothetical protein
MSAKKKKVTEVDPTELNLVPHEEGLTLNCFGEPLRFSNGDIAVHKVNTFWGHVIDEFSNFGVIVVDEDNCYAGPKIICGFNFLEIQRCEIETGKSEFIQNFRDCIAVDNIIRRCAGPELIDQMRRWRPVLDWLEKHEVSLPNHPQTVIESTEEKDVFTTPEDIKFVDFISDQFTQLSNSQKAVVYYFFHTHAAVVFPIVLSQFLCTPSEYANGVMASEVLLTTLGLGLEPDEHAEISRNYRDDAQIADKYIRAYHNLGPDIASAAQHTQVNFDELDREKSKILKELVELTKVTQTSPPKGEDSELDELIEGFKEQLGGRPTCTQDDIARVKTFGSRRTKKETVRDENGDPVYANEEAKKAKKPLMKDKKDKDGNLMHTLSNGQAGKWAAGFDIKGNGRPAKYPTVKVAEALKKEHLSKP